LLLSLADNSADPAALSKQDLLLAALLHALVFIIVTMLAWWQHKRTVMPMRRIEVTMISARDLVKLQHRARPAPRPKRAVKRPRPKVKPVVRPRPKRKPRPTARPVTRPKAPAKVEDDFDPFEPMASSSDRKSAAKSTTHQAKQPEQAKLPGLEPKKSESAGRQMSAMEIDRYIARIQAAVQQQWKVPASLGNVSDPLVEMRLLPTGHIESVNILESSGSAVLDASLIRAIRAAAPFMLPQKQYEFFHVNRIRFHPLK